MLFSLQWQDFGSQIINQNALNQSRCDISRKKEYQVDFWHAGKHASFFQVLFVLLGLVRHVQSTQNNKFVISLQHFKKQVTLIRCQFETAYWNSWTLDARVGRWTRDVSLIAQTTI